MNSEKDALEVNTLAKHSGDNYITTASPETTQNYITTSKRSRGRPKESFKHGIPIQEYKALCRQSRTLWNERSRLIREALDRLNAVSRIEAGVQAAWARAERSRKIREGRIEHESTT